MHDPAHIDLALLGPGRRPSPRSCGISVTSILLKRHFRRPASVRSRPGQSRGRPGTLPHGSSWLGVMQLSNLGAETARRVRYRIPKRLSTSDIRKSQTGSTRAIAATISCGCYSCAGTRVYPRRSKFRSHSGSSQGSPLSKSHEPSWLHPLRSSSESPVRSALFLKLASSLIPQGAPSVSIV